MHKPSVAALIALSLLAHACAPAPAETTAGATAAPAGNTLKWPLGMEPTFRP